MLEASTGNYSELDQRSLPLFGALLALLVHHVNIVGLAVGKQVTLPLPGRKLEVLVFVDQLLLLRVSFLLQRPFA